MHLDTECALPRSQSRATRTRASRQYSYSYQYACEQPSPIVAGVRSVECDSVKWATRVKPIRSILIRQVIIIVIVIVIKEIII